MALRLAEVSKLWEKIGTLTAEVKAKDLELQTMPGLVAEATKLRSMVNELRKAVAKNEENVLVMSGLQK